jgi:ankyrin repeat protein
VKPNGTPAIKAAQEKLKFLGYNPGPSNGLIGAQTVVALKQFQADYGLDSTGKIDSRTDELLFLSASDAPMVYGAQAVHLDHPLHAGDTLAAMGGNAGIQIAGANVSSSGYLGSDDAVASRKLDEINVDYIAWVREDLRKDGGYVSSRDKYGLTPLHNAAQNGQATVARLLLAAKADVNAKAAPPCTGETPLVRALQYDQLTVVRVLLARGADVNAKDNEGRSPMHAVLENHNYMGEERCLRLVAFLVAHEADVNAKDNSGRTPLDYVEEIGTPGGERIAAFLREHGAKPGLIP